MDRPSRPRIISRRNRLLRPEGGLSELRAPFEHELPRRHLISANRVWKNACEERSSYRDDPVTRALFFENESGLPIKANPSKGGDAKPWI